MFMKTVVTLLAVTLLLVTPVAAAPDQFLITPGVGIGPIKLGMPLSEVFARLGSPSSVDTIRAHDVETYTNYVWKEVTYRPQLIVQTRASKPNQVFSIWMLFDRRYNSVSGLRVGMSPAAVEGIMGGPATQVIRLLATSILVYTPRGVGFLVGDDRGYAEWDNIVYGIVVSPEFKVVY
jgi:hypothetical protein